jgi:hypothetical protein
VTGLRLFAAVLLIGLPGAGYQSSALTPEEEKESYQIYSTVLEHLLEDQGPRVDAWTIIQHTRGFDIEMCFRPTKEQESFYRPLFDDYALKNKDGFDLEPRFKLPAYTMIPPEEWGRGSRSRSIAAFSAVGFNHDLTQAAVCLWAHSSGKCYVLIKKNDLWQKDKNWRGGGCFWAA